MIDFLAAPAGKSQDFYRGWDAREAAYERYQDRYHGGWPETDR